MALVLRKRFRVRSNIRNYNNEIGVPLTILGLESGGHSIFNWLVIFIKSIFIIICQIDYPEILVLELGVDKPGDMKYLMGFIPVKVGVFTAIGEFPSHIEFFPEKGRLVKEKALLIKSLDKEGLAVLNYDDLSIRMVGDDLPKKTNILYYGFGQGADLSISNFQLSPPVGPIKERNFGVSFKLEYEGSFVPVRLNGVLGKQRVFAVAAAAGVGLFFGLNLVEISEAFRESYFLPGRTNSLEGIKETWIIDDSYNASPLAVLAVLDILNDIFNSLNEKGKDEKSRRIVVLGDMLELGDKTEDAHRQVGKKVVSVADLLFTVGDRARFIADEARKRGMAKDNIFEFSTSDEAAIPIQEEIKKGDIILVKGSRSIHMEKIIKEIMAEPERADELLAH